MTSIVEMPAGVTGAPVPRRNAGLHFAMLFLFALVAGCYGVGAIGLLRVAYPVACFAFALRLYLRSRPGYVAFTCWVWFLSALVRRLADDKAGYQATSLILLAPYLVTAVSGLQLLTRFRNLARPRSLPFVLAFGAILYGTFVGLTRFSLQQMVPSILNWIVPLFFAFFLVESHREYEAIRRSIKSTFALATAVTGIYAAFQFFVLPGWDQYWLANVATNTFGEAEAMKIRAFSTMNAPVIFALVIMCTFLVTLCLKSRFRFVGVTAGLVGLLFSFNRSAWIGLAGGLIYLLVHATMRERGRILSALLVGALIAPLVLIVPGVGQLVVDRLITMADPTGNVSFQARLEGYEAALATLATEPYGEGVASPDLVHYTIEDDDSIGPHDSLILELLYSLGWCGTFFYLAALAILLARTFSHPATAHPFEKSMKAAIAALFAQCLLNDIVYGEIGVFLWSAGALQLAAIAHSEEEREAEELVPATIMLPGLSGPAFPGPGLVTASPVRPASPADAPPS